MRIDGKKLCKEEDPELRPWGKKTFSEKDQKLSETKPAEQSWKDFYRNEVCVQRYLGGTIPCAFKYPGKMFPLYVNETATVLQTKKVLRARIPQLGPSVRLEDMRLSINGDEIKDDTLLHDYQLYTVNAIYLRIKNH